MKKRDLKEKVRKLADENARLKKKIEEWQDMGEDQACWMEEWSARIRSLTYSKPERNPEGC